MTVQQTLNRLQKRLCTATAFLLLMAAGFAQPATAQAVHTAPGEWAVGPIGITSSNGLAYCSMKTRAASGLSLVIASDSKGAYSVAIDFGKKAIGAGAQYYVTYKIGPISRTMLSIAATNEVLIAQMGVDPDFFDMMKKQNVMDVEFNNDTLRFSLAGAGAALESLETCVKASSEGKTFAPQKLATPEEAAKMLEQRLAVTAELQRNTDMKISEQSVRSSLQDEIQRLQEENRRLRLENQAVSARLRGSDLAAVDDEMELLEQLERQERALKIENDRLRDMAKQAGSIQPSSGAGAMDAAGRTAAAPMIAVRVPDARPAKQIMSPPPPAEKAVDVATVPAVPPQQDAAALEMPRPQQAQAVPVAARAAAAPSKVPVTRQVLHMINMGDMAPERTGGVDVWRWQADNILGAAQSWPLGAGHNMATAAQSYLDALKSRCAGDFAIKLADETGGRHMRWQTAEAACMGADQSSAAGLVFVTVAGAQEMAIVTYEAAPEAVLQALAQRRVLTDALTAAYGR